MGRQLLGQGREPGGQRRCSQLQAMALHDRPVNSEHDSAGSKETARGRSCTYRAWRQRRRGWASFRGGNHSRRGGRPARIHDDQHHVRPFRLRARQRTGKPFLFRRHRRGILRGCRSSCGRFPCARRWGTSVQRPGLQDGRSGEAVPTFSRSRRLGFPAASPIASPLSSLLQHEVQTERNP